MITLINGCVLIPHPANWTTPPRSRRTWQTEIAEALPGAETRQALRAVARRQLTFNVTAATLQERVRLEARMDAALKSGYGFAPLHGRACYLAAAANAGDSALSLQSSTLAWAWQAGDYVFLMTDDQTFDILPITNVAGSVLSLPSSALAYNWPSGQLVWPVIFGAFTADKEEALTGWHANWKITITELVSGRRAQIGVTPAHVPGVGEQQIGSTNIVG